MTDKIDFKKELDSYQARPRQFRMAEIPDLQYLMIDGHGDPNTSPMSADAVAALSPVAGTHHAIYLSDSRKTAPDKLLTILRQPVQQA